MKFKAIFLISNDKNLALEIANKLWESNKSWAVLSCNNCMDYYFKQYIDENKSIVAMSGEDIKDIKPNTFIEFCKKHKVLPMFITNKDVESRLEHCMYTLIEEIFLDSVEYFHAKEDESSYNTFIEINKVYLW